MSMKKIALSGRHVVGGASLLILLLFNVPWLPDHFDFSLDSSWIYVLHDSFINGRQFGNEIIWHYGPLGFLFGKFYHPETYLYLILFYLIFSVIFCWAVFEFITKTSDKPNFAAIIAIAAIVSITLESVFAILPLLFCLYRFFVPAKQKSKYLQLALFVLIALISLIKITYLVLAFVVLVLIDIENIWRGNKKPVYLVGFIGLFLCFWLLAGQGVENVPGFIYGALELSRGFAFAFPPEHNFLIAAGVFLVGIIIVFLQSANIWWRKYGGRAVVPLLILALTCFVLQKSAFTNPNDHHQLESYAAFLILLLLIRDVFFEDLSSKGKGILAVYFVLVATLYVGSIFFNDDKKEQFEAAYSAIEQIGGGKVSDKEGKELELSYEDIFNKKLAGIEEHVSLPEMSGSVDLYSDTQMAIFASGLEYKPRPVFQSYHAYTPYLAKKNKNFLKSGNGPENILFNLRPFRGRYGPMDDGLSWPEILSGYELQNRTEGYLHLTKRRNPGRYDLRKIAEGAFDFDEEVKVPLFFNIWAKIEIEESFLGKIVRLLFRSIPISIEMKYGGELKRFWILPEVAKNGFLLSPPIESTENFMRLYKQQRSFLQVVRHMKIVTDEYPIIGWLYAQDFKVSFEELIIKY